jgi:hypothetical protein
VKNFSLFLVRSVSTAVGRNQTGGDSPINLYPKDTYEHTTVNPTVLIGMADGWKYPSSIGITSD